MLTPDQFDNWCYQQNIPEYTRKIIEQVRSSPPSRGVQGGRSNVCGFYPSQKMGVSIQFESHRDELAHIVDKLEHSADVLEYYNQPPAIELNYFSKKGWRVRRLHTPDFFVIRSSGAGWEECKTEEESGSSGFCGLLDSGSLPIHGGSNQQVVQPIVMILKSIQVLKRRRPSWMMGFGSAAVRMKVP